MSSTVEEAAQSLLGDMGVAYVELIRKAVEPAFPKSEFESIALVMAFLFFVDVVAKSLSADGRQVSLTALKAVVERIEASGGLQAENQTKH